MAIDTTSVPASRPVARLGVRLVATLSVAALQLALAVPVLAQEEGHGEPISLERRLLAVGILVAFVGLMVVWAWLYRRVNRA